jgi:hypothetical protein
MEMQNSYSNKSCTEAEGLDYIFAYMGAVYGAAFSRHWDGSDPTTVRAVWEEIVGVHLTNKPIMDYALSNLPDDFPPSAIAFRNLCIDGVRKNKKIERDPALLQIEEDRKKAVPPSLETLAKLAELRKGVAQ